MKAIKPNTDTKNYWSKVRDFNLSRTNIWILLLLQLMTIVIPFVAIWLLISPDFSQSSFNFYQQLGNQRIVIFVSTAIGLILWSFLLNFISFFVKAQKADSFTFTTSLTFVAFLILVNGLWMANWETRTDLKIFLRFLICLIGLIPAMFAGLLITSLMRNWTYKIEEENEMMLLAYREGQPVPTKQKIRLERALKNKQNREAQAAELALFRQELDQRLSTAYEQHEQKNLDREAKLDAKEAKKRTKDLERKLKKQKK